jgi:hypothetical protein
VPKNGKMGRFKQGVTGKNLPEKPTRILLSGKFSNKKNKKKTRNKEIRP